MNLTQGEALENMVDYCPFVTRAYSELQDAQSKADQKALRRVYGQAKQHLGLLFKEAQEQGISADALTRILLERLPTGVLKDVAQ